MFLRIMIKGKWSRKLENRQMMCYLMMDAAEQAFVEYEEQVKREGYKIAYVAQQAHNGLMHNWDKWRSVTRAESAELQNSMGDMGVGVNAMVWLIVDRCETGLDLYRMFRTVKAMFPSRMNIKLDDIEREAFRDFIENE